MPEWRRVLGRLDVPLRGQLQRPVLPERGSTRANDRRIVSGGRRRPHLPHYHRHPHRCRSLHLLEKEAGTVSEILSHQHSREFVSDLD